MEKTPVSVALLKFSALGLIILGCERCKVENASSLFQKVYNLIFTGKNSIKSTNPTLALS